MLASAACVVIVVATYVLAAHWARDDQAARGARQLQLLAPELESALEKYETLPFVLGFQPEMARALADPRDVDTIEQVNLTLQAIQRQAKVGAIFLMDRSGLTLAASNWDMPVNFIGKSYGFRSYFKDALAGRTGHFYAIGVTTNEPGYFIAQPVRVRGNVQGVIAVKISLADFERNWSGSDEALALVDDAGVVFLSNRPQWKYHSLEPIPAATQQRLASYQQYGSHIITPLLPAPSLAPVTHAIGRVGWKLSLFPSEQRVTRTAAVSALVATAVLVATFGAAFALYQRRRRLQEQRASSAALAKAAQELDSRIAEGTLQLRQTNADLEQKVAALKRTEAMLRSTQNELVQAGKLAMLGQMAAGMTHELNQPLAAIRVFADNARTLLERQQCEPARDNLGHISDSCARMGAIIGQLKGFARKGEEVGTVSLQEALQASALLLQGDIQRVNATLEMALDATPVLVVGDRVRLEQVFINLLRNALDAIEDAPLRHIAIRIRCEGEQVRVSIRDSGPGIPGHVSTRLWEPFFTTKPSGKGLGLGLAISSSIVQAMNGQLVARNHTGGGAEFEVLLPLQPEGVHHADHPG